MFEAKRSFAELRSQAELGNEGVEMLFTCVNCDRPLVRRHPATLYCSAVCQQEAIYVRYARAVTRDGRIKQVDVQQALLIKRAWIFAGGYNPTKELTLTTEVRTLVFERDDGLCVLCGRPATQVDHHRKDASADINDPINLRGLCADCHRAKTLSNLVLVAPEEAPEAWSKSQELDARIAAPTALRPSDDDIGWNELWPTITKERLVFRKANPDQSGPLVRR